MDEFIITTELVRKWFITATDQTFFGLFMPQLPLLAPPTSCWLTPIDKNKGERETNHLEILWTFNFGGWTEGFF